MGRSKRWRQLEKAAENLLTLQKVQFIAMNYRCYECGAILKQASETGWPDLLAPFELLAVECKTGSGKLEPAQKVKKDELIDAGYTYILLKDNCDALLEHFGLLGLKNRRKK